MTVKVKAHPVYGREHAKGHDDLWCAQCASAWDGSDWAEQQAEARVKALEAKLAAVVELVEGVHTTLAMDVLRAAEGKP